MTEFLVEVVESVIVVRIQLERATLSNAGFFRETLIKLIQSGRREIIIDCRNIGFMDSTFLGSLVVSIKKLNSLEGDLRLVFPSKDSPVWTMFETTRMFKVFKTYFSLDDAVSSFKTPIE
jgi:anti-sigma B factor antagonist